MARYLISGCFCWSSSNESLALPAVVREAFSTRMRLLGMPCFLSQEDICPASVTLFFFDAVPPPVQRM